MPRLPRRERRSPADWREPSSYSMYPNPRSRFCISSFEVLLSSVSIFFVSFSSMWITNSSIDSYPAASEHCLTFSSSSPSIFPLCEPNMISPLASCDAWRDDSLDFVILSEAKDLLSRGTGKQQVLRFAQDDNSSTDITTVLPLNSSA